MRTPSLPAASAIVLAGGLLAGTLPGLSRAGSDPAPQPTLAAPLSAVAALGKQMFFDPHLSASGQMSCAFCHDPANHYGPPARVSAAVISGGPDMNRPGLRAVPTLTYKFATPPFSIGPTSPESEAAEATPMQEAENGARPEGALRTAGAQLLARPGAPKAKTRAAGGNIVARGGLFWDGRAADLQDQSLGPLLSPFEMANASLADLAATIRAGYGKELGQLFGAQILKDDRMTVDEAAFAIARFEIEDVSFHPFSSKYDAYLAGRAQLSPQEAVGLRLFNDPNKGNCAACHLDTPSADDKPPMFTDFEFEALGVPRNPQIPANRNPAYHDLGLCGPLRDDAAARQPENCGLFKTPTLRNVATRKAFFHNGIYSNLTQVVRFYARRAADPAAIYPRGPGGKVDIFNDLPRKYWGNIDRIDAPFDRHPGDPPALSDAEIADIVAFLKTLTDGWMPAG